MRIFILLFTPNIMMLGQCKEKIYNGEDITRQEAITLAKEPLEELATAADEITNILQICLK